jgi:hypothetical protein
MMIVDQHASFGLAVVVMHSDAQCINGPEIDLWGEGLTSA